MENDRYVTVIPVEYPRTGPGRLYPHPGHRYHDLVENDAHDHEHVYNLQNANHRELSETTHRIFVPNKLESCGINELDNSRLDCQSQDSIQNLQVCIYLMNDVVLRMELEDGKNTTATDLVQCILRLDELQLTKCAKDIFALWMSSSLLELQLKPLHKPLLVRSKWMNLLSRFAHTSQSRQLRDEPILSFQRNVFYSLGEEQKLTDLGALELLYEEAKCNILEGRYPCDVSQYTMLGGIQARLELGPCNPQVHSNKYLRSQKNRFLPVYARHDPITSWLRSQMKNSAEVRLLEHYKRIPSNASERVLQRRYLEVCWSFPFYGCAFFQGQIEEPVRGIASLLLHQDMPILVGINERGIYIIDNNGAKLLLGLRYEELSWELGQPNKQNFDCLPCLFIQFVITENGARVSKLMQIFSKQADMMDALISTFVAQIKEKMCSSCSNDELDGLKNINKNGSFLNKNQFCKIPTKLSKFTLATFNDEGHCIGQTGSLKFVY